MKTQPRKSVIGRDVDIGKALVVTQDDIESRLVALDQIVFENDRLVVRVRDGHLDARNLPHHRGRLDVGVAALEVARYAFLEIPGLADVNHLAARIEHPVDAGAVGQAADKGLGVEIAFVDRAHRHFRVTARAGCAPWRRPRGTCPASGGPYWCCSGCNGRNRAR